MNITDIMSAAEDSNSEFASTHILSSREDVLNMLRLVATAHARVVVSFGDGNTTLSAKLAHINLHFDELILADGPASTSAPVALPPLAPDLVTILSKNKLQFHIDHIERTVFDAKPALRMRIPKLVYCSERREDSRVSPPRDQSLRCLVHDGGAKQSAALALPVVDVSTGGLSLLVHPFKLQVQVGKELRNCKLALPDIGATSFDLVIRNITEASHSEEGRRCGCQFTAISSEMLALIERYVDLHRDKS